jgi:glycosyltransferase involved in cell wall biosynthesis
MTYKRYSKDKYPKVSVLIPVFNGQEFVGECIDSILSQTYENFELLVVNDGSTDLTEAIVLSRNDKRIRYLKNRRNLGIVKTLNKGLYLSEGKFVARMDADDISLPDRLEKQISYLVDNPDVDILGAGIILNEHESMDNHREVSSVIKNEHHRVSLLRSNPLAHPTVVFNRESLLNNKLYYDRESQLAEDYKLWADSSINNLNIESLTDKLLLYRVHEKQLSRQKSISQTLVARSIQLLLGQYYFKDLLFGREFDYIRLINKLPLQEDEVLSSRETFVKDLIAYNNKHSIFDTQFFSETFNSLVI